MLRWGLAAAGCLLIMGCAGWAKNYRAPRVIMTASSVELHQAVLRNAMNQGWRLLQNDSATGTLEALREASDPMERERWSFSVFGSVLQVRRTREVRSDRDLKSPWQSTSIVPADYTYEVEYDQIERVRSLLQ
jgi:hypothetical protein